MPQMTSKIAGRTRATTALMKKMDVHGVYFVAHFPNGESWVSIVLENKKGTLLTGIPKEVTEHADTSVGRVGWEGKKLIFEPAGSVGKAKSRGSGKKGRSIITSFKALKNSKLKFLKSSTVGALDDSIDIEEDETEDETEDQTDETEEVSQEDMEELIRSVDTMTPEDIVALIDDRYELSSSLNVMMELMEFLFDSDEDDEDDEDEFERRSREEVSSAPVPFTAPISTEAPPGPLDLVDPQEGEPDFEDDRLDEGLMPGVWNMDNYQKGEPRVYSEEEPPPPPKLWERDFPHGRFVNNMSVPKPISKKRQRRIFQQMTFLQGEFRKGAQELVEKAASLSDEEFITGSFQKFNDEVETLIRVTEAAAKPVEHELDVYFKKLGALLEGLAHEVENPGIFTDSDTLYTKHERYTTERRAMYSVKKNFRKFRKQCYTQLRTLKK